MIDKNYDPEKSIFEKCEKNNIVFTDPIEFESLKVAKLLNLVDNELAIFLQDEKDNDYYILYITDPLNKEAKYPFRIHYTGGKEVEKLKEKEELLLDGNGRSITNLCDDVSSLLKDKDILFYRVDSRQIVEIGKVKLKKEKEEVFTGFLEMKDKRFVTLIERFADVGQIYKTKLGEFFGIKSLSPHKADIVLCSHILENSLKKIDRIFQIPLPIIYENKLTFPKKGYDFRFNSWRPHNSPELKDKKMSLKKSKGIINQIFSEFCFKSEQDKVNAIAGFLTPYLKGLLKDFNERTPVFFYVGNRERVGKDYCAGITGILYEDKALDDSPICSGGREGSNNEELRKKITSALLAGRKRMHFANNKGYINNAVFEGVVTSKFCSDRLLGKNEMINISNEIDFSLSGNVGVTYTPDFANRCRFVNLFLEIEDANSRIFENPILHDWIKENKGLILSALYSLVRNWINKGKPKGSVPFASFSNWADICGGIMECAGLGNPCVIDKESLSLSGDSETVDMKQLFERCFETYPDAPLNKAKIVALIKNEELFSYIDFESRKGQTIFGLTLRKFIGRILSNIKLEVSNPNIERVSRQEYVFKGVGNVGIVGNVSPIATYGSDKYNWGVEKDAKDTKDTKIQKRFKSLVNIDFVSPNGVQIKLKKGKIYDLNYLGEQSKKTFNILLKDKAVEILK